MKRTSSSEQRPHIHVAPGAQVFVYYQVETLEGAFVRSLEQSLMNVVVKHMVWTEH
jgi:hypothetical protein